MTFRDNGIKVLKYIHLETVSHLVQHLFFANKLAKQKVFVLRQWNLFTISTRSGHTSSENFKQWKFQGAALSVKEVIKQFRGVNFSGAHCNWPSVGGLYPRHQCLLGSSDFDNFLKIAMHYVALDWQKMYKIVSYEAFFLYFVAFLFFFSSCVQKFKKLPF